MIPPDLTPEEWYDYEERVGMLLDQSGITEPEAERRALREIINRRPKQGELF